MLSRQSLPSIRPFLRIVALLAAMAVPGGAGAQEAQEAEQPASFCRTGRPAHACREFLVAHLSYYPELNEQARAEPWRWVEWEVGAMVNHLPAHAAGAALAVGTSERHGFYLALKGRYRLWLMDGAALDAGAGLLVAQHPINTYPHQRITGWTADASVGLTDWAALIVRAYTLEGGAEDGGNVSGGDLGVRVGTRPGLIVTVLGLVAMFVTGLNAS
jgi:hypothetical protein